VSEPPLTEPTSLPANGSGGRQVRPRRRRLVFACLAGAIAWVSIAGWYWWTRSFDSTLETSLPEIPLAEADPAVREAVETLLQKVRRQPRSAEAWGLLGKFLRAHEYDAPAAHCFVRAERLDPKNPRWPYYQGLILHDDPEAALPHLRRAADLADQAVPPAVTPRLVLAESLLQGGHYEESERQLRHVQERERDNPRVHYLTGLLAIAQGDQERACEHFLQAAASPFARQKANAQLAAIFQHRQDKEAVAQCMRQVMQPPLDLPWPDPFVQEYKELQIGPERRYQEAAQFLQQGRHAEAENLLRQIAEEYRDGRALILLGEQQLQQGRLEQAEQTLRQALTQTPDSGQALQLLSMTLFRQGEQLGGAHQQEAAHRKYQVAADSATRALEVKPNLALAESYRGLSLWRLGRREEAFVCLHAAIHVQPQLADAHLFLGEVLAEEGCRAEAKKFLHRAAQLASPGDRRAQAALQRLQAASK
jgi:tetratricopeptide (TPR) repeat protein